MSGNPSADAIDSALAAANVMLRVAARSVLEVEDRVTTPQLRVLMLVETSGPQSLTDVAAELGVHPSNATRTCDKLVRAGYLTRTENPDDRRYASLELTETGRELIEYVIHQRRQAMAEVFAKLDESQLDGVARALRAFASAAGGHPSLDGRFTFGPEV